MKLNEFSGVKNGEKPLDNLVSGGVFVFRGEIPGAGRIFAKQKNVYRRRIFLIYSAQNAIICLITRGDTTDER